MAGIYIHIPFCKQACNYCNFYFITSDTKKSAFISALINEIALSKDYLESNTIETIYLGGGTPSILSSNEIKLILDSVNKYYKVELSEFTIECNPDDLNSEKLTDFASLKSYGLNRFSIGVQSFIDRDLKFLNRAHSAEEAVKSIKRTQDKGFDLLTADLIYGIPELPNDEWQYNLEKASELNLEHLSCYALTVEPKTKLFQQIKKGEVPPPESDIAAEQFDMLMAFAKTHGYIHYEISNFAKPGKIAIHNSNYWNGKNYLGLGPSAHSYNQFSRRWNISNLMNYLQALQSNTIPYEEEQLSEADKTNEYIMTSLRKIEGCDLAKLSPEQRHNLLSEISKMNAEWYKVEHNCLILTNKGKHFADYIASGLFITN